MPGCVSNLVYIVLHKKAETLLSVAHSQADLHKQFQSPSHLHFPVSYAMRRNFIVSAEELK